MAKAKARVKSDAASDAESNGVIYDIKSLGESLRLVRTDNLELSHEFAKELLAMPSFIGERSMKKRHAANLLHNMQRGTFHWNLVTIAVCKCAEEHNGYPKGTTFRINGQHTCSSRLEMPPSYRAPVRMARYTAATVQDLRILYAAFDRNSPRTKDNVITSYTAGTPSLGVYGHHTRRYLASGIAMWKWKDPQARAAHDGDDIAYLLLEGEKQLVKVVADFFDQFSYAEHRHMMRAPVVAALFETFSVNPAKSNEFWSPVGTGLGLHSPTDPRKKLNKLLMTTAVVGGAGTHKAKLNSSPLISQEAMYRVCVHCFNLFVKGDALKVLHVPSKRPNAISSKETDNGISLRFTK